MKILYTITGLSVGGAERITIDLAEKMVQLENTVAVIFLDGEQLISTSKNIIVYNLNMKKTLFGFINALDKARKIIRDFKPDVVHANMFHAIIFSRILRLFIKIPLLICTEHSNNYHGKIRKTLEYSTDFLSDLNTNVSQLATDYFVESKVFSKSKSIAMYNGVDMNRFCKNRNGKIRTQLNVSNEDFVFINVSRFNEAKDHKTLLKAFSIVYKKEPNAKLLLVGDGELRSEIQMQIRDLYLSDSVILVGIQQNTQDYYNASNCFVLSSAYEGFGLVLVEAMACELPVISTDCGGTKEIVADINNLVPVKSPELLAEKMLEVMNYSSEQIEYIGKLNRQCVEKFDLEKITSIWENLYNGNFS